MRSLSIWDVMPHHWLIGSYFFKTTCWLHFHGLKFLFFLDTSHSHSVGCTPTHIKSQIRVGSTSLTSMCVPKRKFFHEAPCVKGKFMASSGWSHFYNTTTFMKLLCQGNFMPLILEVHIISGICATLKYETRPELQCHKYELDEKGLHKKRWTLCAVR